MFAVIDRRNLETVFQTTLKRGSGLPSEDGEKTLDEWKKAAQQMEHCLAESIQGAPSDVQCAAAYIIARSLAVLFADLNEHVQSTRLSGTTDSHAGRPIPRRITPHLVVVGE